jgi:hypothetical protein
MEAMRSSETSVNARSTQRHIPEDIIQIIESLAFWTFQNLKFFSPFQVLFVCESSVMIEQRD